MSNDVNFAEKNSAWHSEKKLRLFSCFLGVFWEKSRAETWLLDGKNVVKCVVNVG